MKKQILIAVIITVAVMGIPMANMAGQVKGLEEMNGLYLKVACLSKYELKAELMKVDIEGYSPSQSELEERANGIIDQCPSTSS